MADAFLTPPIRYLGYGYGYNEATGFSHQYEQLLIMSANIYIFTHVIVKSLKAPDLAHGAVMWVDTLVFHLLASIVIPVVIASVVRAVTDELMHMIRARRQLHRWFPAIMVVAALIIASKPVDDLVNQLMDTYFRKVLRVLTGFGKKYSLT